MLRSRGLHYKGLFKIIFRNCVRSPQEVGYMLYMQIVKWCNDTSKKLTTNTRLQQKKCVKKHTSAKILYYIILFCHICLYYLYIYLSLKITFKVSHFDSHLDGIERFYFLSHDFLTYYERYIDFFIKISSLWHSHMWEQFSDIL